MAEEEKSQPQKGGNSSVMLVGVLLFLVVILGTSLLIVLLTTGGRGARYPVSYNGKFQDKKAERPKPGILVPLGGDIIVNLAETGGASYLKVNAVLEVDNPKAAEEIKTRAPQIRDLMIGILRLKTAEKISEKEGINEIRSEIISSINRVLYEGKVVNLYFSDFIMQ